MQLEIVQLGCGFFYDKQRQPSLIFKSVKSYKIFQCENCQGPEFKMKKILKYYANKN